MKRAKYICLILAAACAFLAFASAEGFSDDPERINQAAKSVMKLEVLDKNGDIIKTGSGFVAFDNRHLITNYHVADGADMIYAYSDTGDPYIIMDVCISDSQKDIAVLQFFSPTDMSPLTLNESGEVTRASSVVAIGSPKGFSNSVSSGIVSSVFEEDGCGYIQFTAPISSGSSGGALFNDDGVVIGITSMNYDDGMGVSQNLNFAVNIKEAVALFSSFDGEKHGLSSLSISDVSASKMTSTPSPKPTPSPTPKHIRVTIKDMVKNWNKYVREKVEVEELWVDSWLVINPDGSYSRDFDSIPSDSNGYSLSILCKDVPNGLLELSISDLSLWDWSNGDLVSLLKKKGVKNISGIGVVLAKTSDWLTYQFTIDRNINAFYMSHNGHGVPSIELESFTITLNNGSVWFNKQNN